MPPSEYPHAYRYGCVGEERRTGISDVAPGMKQTLPAPLIKGNKGKKGRSWEMRVANAALAPRAPPASRGPVIN